MSCPSNVGLVPNDLVDDSPIKYMYVLIIGLVARFRRFGHHKYKYFQGLQRLEVYTEVLTGVTKRQIT
jgi:hypothetical protein